LNLNLGKVVELFRWQIQGPVFFMDITSLNVDNLLINFWQSNLYQICNNWSQMFWNKLPLGYITIVSIALLVLGLKVVLNCF
jgi:hypothetical protein